MDLSGLGIPMNLDEALQWDDLPNRASPDEPGASPGAGCPRITGAAPAERNSQIRRFFQAVDPVVSKVLMPSMPGSRGGRARGAMYAQVSGYNHLVEDGIDGNPEGLRDDELLEKAWPIVQPTLRQPLMKAFDRYGVLQAWAGLLQPRELTEGRPRRRVESSSS